MKIYTQAYLEFKGLEEIESLADVMTHVQKMKDNEVVENDKGQSFTDLVNQETEKEQNS